MVKRTTTFRIDTYREQLRALISDPEKRLVLNADKWWNERHPNTGEVHAAFQVDSSEQFQKEFITLWELFDNPDESERCLKELAAEVLAIRSKFSFSTIVSSTATISRHILERLHARIETPVDKVRIEFLNRYPFLSNDRKMVLSFQGENVLIFSDVLASGRLVADLARVVHHLGGKVIGILCVVLTEKRLIDQLSIWADGTRDRRPRILLAQNPLTLDADRIPPLSSDGTAIADSADEWSEDVPVFSLTDVPITELGPNDYQESQLIPIDLESSYPEELPLGVAGVRTRFTIAQMYRHFESAEAIKFDFFENGGTKFTTGIRLPRLLEGVGDEIWKEIEPEFECMYSQQCQVSRFAMVTTFRADDTRFKSFVESRLRTATRRDVEADTSTCMARMVSVHINIRELPEGADYMLVPRGSDRLLEGAHVFLLLASVSASQTLEDLIAFLAGNAVQAITVIVLINRLGLCTQNFVARIRRVARGLLPNGSEEATFELVPVYSLNELRSRDIRALEDAIGTLFKMYRERTKVPGFRNWIEQTRRYFEPQIVTGIDFHTGSLRRLPSPMVLEVRGDGMADIQHVELLTLEAALSCLCHRLVADCDYDELINLLASLDQKKDLYQVFALLLHGVAVLRRRNRFETVRTTILDRIQRLRKSRFDAELERHLVARGLSEIIERTVELEAYLVFGLALFSYMDLQHENYDNILVECLTASCDVETWMVTPLNFLIHFSDERLAWSISMLLLLSRQRFGEDQGWLRLRGNLVGEIQRYKGIIQSRKPEFEAMLAERAREELPRSVETMVRLCRDNLDALLTDLGHHRLVRYDEIIRFLHSHLLQKPHHSPITSTLKTLELSLSEELQNGPRGENVTGRVKIQDANSRRALDEASSTIGLLEQIAHAAVDMFGFTPAERERVHRFAEPYAPDSFFEDVQQLGRKLRAIRHDNTVSGGDFTVIEARIQRIEEDLFRDESALRQSLERYRVSLVDAVVEAMRYSRHRFSSTLRDNPQGRRQSKRYSRIFDDAIREWEAMQRDTNFVHPFVLVDPFLLRETLRNVFTNVRHTVRGFNLKPSKYPGLLSVSFDFFERSIENDLTPMVRLTLRCKSGRRAPQPELGQGTLQQQSLTLQKYSASLEVKFVDSPTNCFCTTLEMIRRTPPLKSEWKRDRL